MLVRIRTNVGVWRIENLNDATATVNDIISGIKLTRPHVVFETAFCTDPGCQQPLNDQILLSSQGVRHGAMIHVKVDSSTCLETKLDTVDENQTSKTSTAIRKVIKPDGSIQIEHIDPSLTNKGQDRGFRPGMMALRDMKMSWTLNDFIEMDEKYVFKIKRQDKGSWSSVSLDSSSCQDFYRYLSLFEFKQHRFGFLYGTVEEDPDKEDGEEKWKVKVECIYEPPQEANPNVPEMFDILDDPREERVEKLASMLNLQKVGWIFGHSPRENIEMTNAEIIMAAEYQLEAAGGIKPTPFVSVKVTIGPDGNVSFEAFQMSLQCMEMVAEEAIEINPTDQGSCAINPTFTAIQEGKQSKTVDNSFFLAVAPIHQHISDKFVSQFPKSNRMQDEVSQTHTEMKKQLSKSGSQGWTFVDLLADFHLLLYLCDFLDVETDVGKICESVVNRDVALDDGYKIIISSMAGMDTHY